MKKAFTLVELMVSMAVLALIMAGAGLIFKICIDSYRTASATAEIMRNLRGITDQLNTDFKGIRKDALFAIRFEKDIYSTRHDQIVFFANGDFQSVQADYEYKKTDGSIDTKSVAGNVARLYYGRGDDPGADEAEEPDRLIIRRQRILTVDDTSLDDTDPDSPTDPNEYEFLSLAEWRTKLVTEDYKVLIPGFFEPRVDVDTKDPDTIHMLMCEDVNNFQIQYQDPNGAAFPETNDTDFDGADSFGHFYNVSGVAPDLNPIFTDAVSGDWTYPITPAPLPRALKFTFTLHDSKGVIKNGMTFTHIVYIGD